MFYESEITATAIRESGFVEGVVRDRSQKEVISPKLCVTICGLHATRL